tara:strand:- start:119722 stop:120249 length:528 start_codon:yes stop_codon:yes gene_type:complete
MSSTRLTPDIWIAAGLAALAVDGAQALAAEPMARRLGATKGSFYWHFKDVSAYHVAVLARWQVDALAALEEQAQASGPADQRLRAFGHRLLNDPVEGQMRRWAQVDGAVAQILKELDAQRLAFLTSLLRHLGLGNPDFARALLAVIAGLPQITPDAPSVQLATFDTLVDTVLALS